MSQLARVGKILAAGFGDKVAMGIFLGFLEDVTPEEAYDYIKNNRSRVDEIPASDWESFREHAQGLNLKMANAPNAERILDLLKKDHPDLVSIIINTPNGKEWLDSEIEKAKEKLEV